MLARWDEVPAAAERMHTALGTVPPDVRVLWAKALLADGRPQEACRLLADGLDDAPHHPDLFYMLLAAAGVGYTGSALRNASGIEPFDGVCNTLSFAGPVVRALVHVGVLRETVLDRIAPPRSGEVRAPTAASVA